MKYECIIFDLYNTLIDDKQGLGERDKYRLDMIYTILEKALYPVKYNDIAHKYAEMMAYTGGVNSTGKSFHPFDQIKYLLESLNIHDIIVMKKVYDVLTGAVLQINPQPMPNAEKALRYLKDNQIKVGLVSNTNRTPGHVLRILLKEIGLYDFFDDLVFSDEVGYLKPQEILFNLAVSRLGVDKSKTLFIGDLKSVDYDGAIRAGLNAHLFNSEKEDLFQLAVSYSGGY